MFWCASEHGSMIVSWRGASILGYIMHTIVGWLDIAIASMLAAQHAFVLSGQERRRSFRFVRSCIVIGTVYTLSQGMGAIFIQVTDRVSIPVVFSYLTRVLILGILEVVIVVRATYVGRVVFKLDRKFDADEVANEAMDQKEIGDESEDNMDTSDLNQQVKAQLEKLKLKFRVLVAFALVDLSLFISSSVLLVQRSINEHKFRFSENYQKVRYGYNFPRDAINYLFVGLVAINQYYISVKPNWKAVGDKLSNICPQFAEQLFLPQHVEHKEDLLHF